MSRSLDLLTAAVATRSGNTDVALLLPGGIDSLLVGLALEAAGKRVHAYTFVVEGHPSTGFKKARQIAAHFRWPLNVIEVPTRHLAADFLRLAVEHGCCTRMQLQLGFPMMYLLAAIEEREVWTGLQDPDWRVAQRIAARCGKTLLDPCLNDSVFDHFLQFELISCRH